MCDPLGVFLWSSGSGALGAGSRGGEAALAAGDGSLLLLLFFPVFRNIETHATPRDGSHRSRKLGVTFDRKLSAGGIGAQLQHIVHGVVAVSGRIRAGANNQTQIRTRASGSTTPLRRQRKVSKPRIIPRTGLLCRHRNLSGPVSTRNERGQIELASLCRCSISLGRFLFNDL